MAGGKKKERLLTPAQQLLQAQIDEQEAKLQRLYDQMDASLNGHDSIVEYAPIPSLHAVRHLTASGGRHVRSMREMVLDDNSSAEGSLGQDDDDDDDDDDVGWQLEDEEEETDEDNDDDDNDDAEDINRKNKLLTDGLATFLLTTQETADTCHVPAETLDATQSQLVLELVETLQLTVHPAHSLIIRQSADGQLIVQKMPAYAVVGNEDAVSQALSFMQIGLTRHYKQVVRQAANEVRLQADNSHGRKADKKLKKTQRARQSQKHGWTREVDSDNDFGSSSSSSTSQIDEWDAMDDYIVTGGRKQRGGGGGGKKQQQQHQQQQAQKSKQGGGGGGKKKKQQSQPRHQQPPSVKSRGDRADKKKQQPQRTVRAVVEAAALSSTNVGHQLLSKMGWKTGDALGQASDGITEPIKATVHARGRGLGA